MNLNFDSNDLEAPNGDPNDEFNQVNFIRQLIDRLANVPGDEQWLKISHGHIVTFLAYDSEVLSAANQRQEYPQIQVWAHPRVSRIQYLLPRENWPWQYAEAIACDMDQLVDFIADAFKRCESRRENLVNPINVG